MAKTERERCDYIVSLDEELLLGGVVLSEWCSLIVREADTAFVAGADLASILTAAAAIETHLRAEYGSATDRFKSLIDAAAVSDELRQDMHRLRLYRNTWVHVRDPSDDGAVLEEPSRYEGELQEMAAFAMRTLRRVLYHDQWV